MSSTFEAIDVIERQAAVLVRHFELLHRRSDVHDSLDRAGYLLLRTLDDRGPMDINTLAATLGVDPSTAGRQISAMQGAGLVLRTPGETDRRRSVITATQDGLATMTYVRQRRAEDLAELLAGWGEDELRTLGEMFGKYNRAVAARYLSGQAPSGEQPVAEPTQS
ncbi:MarR family transcriptional regulator [Streptomyces sp. HNM0575]|uniref:MarR family winged helix-turn-helix transcriptional regulator n=1 Tax=Streptomyces sp. HNM0575 TaxID=2716338 RepID=UPI003218029D